MRTEYHANTDNDECVLEGDELQGKGSQKRSNDKRERASDTEKADHICFSLIDFFKKVRVRADLDKARSDSSDKENGSPGKKAFGCDETDAQSRNTHNNEANGQKFFLAVLLVFQFTDRNFNKNEWQEHDTEHETNFRP